MKLTQLGSLYKLIRGESRNMRKSVAKQPRQRASAFVLESLENRVLLSATPVDVTTTEPVVTAAVVTTDKPDYAPGETALITTSNTSADGLKFGDGELVHFQVTRTDGIEDAPMGNLPWYVTDGVGGFAAYQDTIVDSNNDGVAESGDRNADGIADWIRPDTDLTVNGSISTNWFVEDQYLNSSLLLTATGQTNGAVATTEFTDSPRVGTVTVGSQSGVLVSGVAGSTNYTFDVFRDSNNNNAAPATVAITGLPVGVTVSGLTTSITLAGTNNTTTSAYSGTFTLNTPSSIAASSYNFTVQVTATQGNGNDSSTGAGSLVVNPGTVATTTTVSSSDDTSTFGDSVTFTATVARTTGTGAPTGSVTFNIAGIGSGFVGTAGSTTATTATWTYTTTATALAAGNHAVQAFYVHSGSFTDSTGNITQTVSKASSTTTTVGAGSFTYDGTTHTGGSGTVTGAGGLNVSATSLTYSGDQINAGSYTVTAHYAGDANHFGSDGAAVTITIDKASSTTTTVGAGPFTYDGTTHTGGSGTVTGAGGLNVSATSLTYSGDQINAGSYTVTAHYAGDANHFGSDGAAVTITIDKASSTTTTTGASFIYDGSTHTGGSGTVTGAGGLNVSATSLTYSGDQINAGSYTVTAHYAGDANHFGSDGAAVTITIDKASSTTTATGASFIYDGSTHTGGSAVVSGAGTVTGSAVLSYSGNQVNAGQYTVTATYAGDANHTGSSDSATITIGKATLTGLATTQSALNIAKQGALVFSLNNITGMVDGDTLVSLLSTMSFTLKIGGYTYDFAPSVAIDTHGDGDASNDTVVVTYSLKNGGDAGQLAFDLQALNMSDGTASTSASNAQVDAIFVHMSTANYTFCDDALTKLFYSLK